MNELSSVSEPEWDHVAPLLDEAMHELCQGDRLAVLLRFFQQKGLREVGLALGLSENAARMRVDRALALETQPGSQRRIPAVYSRVLSGPLAEVACMPRSMIWICLSLIRRAYAS